MPRRARISPISTAFLIYAVVMAALFPPLAPVFFLLAWISQHTYRREHRQALRRAEAARAARIQEARRAQLELAYRFGNL